MRTISDIKNIITTDFMSNTTIAQKYGFTAGASFSETFSSTSIESILFYIVAVSIYVLEGLFGEHKSDVNALIEETLPHRPKWYRDKALAFMKGMTLVTDSDVYDTTDMTDDEIEAAKVVKYAAATETKDSALLTIKVAGDTNGELAPLDEETETQLKAYIAEIKDAGVRVSLVNQEADSYDCEMDIYYDALLTESIVKENVETAIKDYIGGLPFNGEYTNMDCVDAVQAVDGIKIVEMKNSSVMVYGESTRTNIEARHRPAAGYMKAGTLTINMKVYDEQI